MIEWKAVVFPSLYCDHPGCKDTLETDEEDIFFQSARDLCESANGRGWEMLIPPHLVSLRERSKYEADKHTTGKWLCPDHVPRWQWYWRKFVHVVGKPDAQYLAHTVDDNGTKVVGIIPPLEWRPPLRPPPRSQTEDPTEFMSDERLQDWQQRTGKTL